MVHAEVKFDWTFFKRFLKLCHWMFPSVCSKAVLMSVFLLLLSLLEQVLIYNIGVISSKYLKILGVKDREGFTTHTISSVLFILAEALTKSLITYVASMLYITWRRSLCRSLHQVYFSNIIYYHVNVMKKSIDNPDQRITQDVDRLTSTFSQVFVPLIISPFTIGYYMYQVVDATGYLGPVSVLVFFTVFTIINKLLMSRVVPWVYRQERREGDFRFKHMQMRVYAESAAFYKADKVEERKTNHKLGQLISTQRRLIHWELLLNFAINTADYLGSILSYIAIAFPIFLGHYDNLSPADVSALISKNAFVSIYLINCFTKLIDLANSVTDVAGTAHRIGQLSEVMGQVKADQEENASFLDEIHTRSSWDSGEGGGSQEMSVTEPAFKIDSITYGPPESSVTLCRNLSLTIQSGSNVLVTGDSGCGKTSLLRVIAGLWKPRAGHVDRLVKQGPVGLLYLPQKPYLTTGSLRDQVSLLYLPQKPYLTTGSLRDQILFPCVEADVVPDDERIYQYLTVAGLDELLGRLGGLDSDYDWNWYDELSPGEMQRLSFVRLFFHKPKFAMLDEATSQVSQEMESRLYLTCQHLGISLLSIGHRDSIRQFHQHVIHFDGSGGWTFNPIADSHTPGGGDGDGGGHGVDVEGQGVALSGVHISESEQ